MAYISYSYTRKNCQQNTYNSNHMVYAEISQQPASLRFRYQCEMIKKKPAGFLTSINSKTQRPIYPEMKIYNYNGEFEVTVSCVTKDRPYRAHPHKLVGDNCEDGVLRYKSHSNGTVAIVRLSKVGIQCVKINEIENSLEKRKIDPFNCGFKHMKHRPQEIGLDVVRLCFTVDFKTNASNVVQLKPLVSDPIYDKKKKSKLVINYISHTSIPASGGAEMMILSEKVNEGDVKVRFFDKNTSWEGFETFSVYKGIMITLLTPPYNAEISKGVLVFIELVRLSDGETSEPRQIYMVPDDNYQFYVRNTLDKYLNPQRKFSSGWQTQSFITHYLLDSIVTSDSSFGQKTNTQQLGTQESISTNFDNKTLGELTTDLQHQVDNKITEIVNYYKTQFGFCQNTLLDLIMQSIHEKFPDKDIKYQSKILPKATRVEPNGTICDFFNKTNTYQCHSPIIQDNNVSSQITIKDCLQDNTMMDHSQSNFENTGISDFQNEMVGYSENNIVNADTPYLSNQLMDISQNNFRNANTSNFPNIMGTYPSNNAFGTSIFNVGNDLDIQSQIYFENFFCN